jgi:two-component system, NtrC family, nitrogen regulation response regulator GlnG
VSQPAPAGEGGDLMRGSEIVTLPPMDPVRTIADAVPALVDGLIGGRPGRVHHDIVALVERAVFARVLELTGGNQLRAARLLGINRNTLRRRCRRLEVTPPNGGNGRNQPTVKTDSNRPRSDRQ